MENKDLYHMVTQIEQFWEYYPIEVIENVTDDDITMLDNDIENKQEQIYYF